MQTHEEWISEFCQISIKRRIHPTHDKYNETDITLDTSCGGYEMTVNGVTMSKLAITLHGEYEWESFRTAMVVELVKERLK